MRRFIFNEWSILLFLLLAGILIRSIHFSSYLNFSTEQAVFASKSLEIWRNKEIELIGPSISFHYIGRDLYQGSITYYFQLVFLLLSNFDPIISAYLYMVFSMCMIIPLYVGVKMLGGRRAAMLSASLYSLVFFYIDYTRFFWNPNFQFSLTPLLIYSLGLYARSKKTIHLFIIGITSGILLLFHYQYVLIILALGIYYVFIKQVSLLKLTIFIAGVTLGFSPLIIFELRNNFYNTQTLILYLANYNKVFSNGLTKSFNYHYVLSISLLCFVSLACILRNSLKSVFITLLTITLFVTSLLVYGGQKPSHGFGMADDWNYLYEKKAYDLIRQEKLQNYNVVHQGYDTLANVQKYLHKRDRIAINYDDYYHNKYLFIITNRSNYRDDSAYEVNTFKPAKLIKQWTINEKYKLYLLERLDTNPQSVLTN